MVRNMIKIYNLDVRPLSEENEALFDMQLHLIGIFNLF